MTTPTPLHVPAIKNSIDRVIHALEGRVSQGLAPASLLLAYYDWLVHLSNSPGKIGELIENALTKGANFSMWSAHSAFDKDSQSYIEPLSGDRRFQSNEWKAWPFNVLFQSFLMVEQWWHYATTGIQGMSSHHQDVAGFSARQVLDIFSPSNFLLTNPEVLKTTWEHQGGNLAGGIENFLADLQDTISGKDHRRISEFKAGKNLAITPGKVVYQNRLIELIQYAPTTPQVYGEPVLIVPAWIMKYYILDLQPQNSLVRYLVEKGHTVFMISWKNPTEEDRDLDLEDYINLGVMAAIDAVGVIDPRRKIHATGYCLGGTILAMAAAAMFRENDLRLKSISLFTAQTDFTEAGELNLFIDESQVSFMEEVMWDKGYLDTAQMAGAFQLLRSNDLIWSRLVKSYLLGEDEKLNDLMTWNADATRMPYKMHSQYLRKLFLDNDLAAGRFEVRGRPIGLIDLHAPIFTVSTQNDHVAPWHSVYKIPLLPNTEVTFLLATGGHNAGIVSEPGRPNRHFQISVTQATDKYVDPDEWRTKTPVDDGSWWPAWQKWLVVHSSRRKKPPPSMGNEEKGYPPLRDAPGTYVLEP